MDRQDIHKLLGGYATGTLTPEEQEALFAAALDDQELFDALAREQALREVLTDPVSRGRLLASLEERPQPWFRRFWRPLAIATAAACGVVAFGVYVNRPPKQTATAPSLVAELRPAERVPVNPPAAPRQEEPMKRAVAPPQNHPAPREPQISDDKKAPAPVPLPVAPAAPAPVAAPAGAPVGLGGAPPELAKERDALKDLDTRKAEGKPEPAAADLLISGNAGVAVQEAAGGRGGRGTGSLSALRDASYARAISLQNAEALFYDRPQAVDSTSPIQQHFAPQPQAPAQGQQAQGQQAQGLQNKQEQGKVQQRQTTEALKTFSAMMARPTRPAGVKWTVLRRREGVGYAEVSADQLAAGDAVKLRLISNVDGFLSVFDGAAALVRGAPVKALEPFDTPEIASAQAGRKVLVVQLDRTSPAPAAPVVRNALEQQSATDAVHNTTYVLTTSTNPVASVQATVLLTFKAP